ncbi:MerR family transcriptional regulator [Vibrio cholerae]|uniref:helix-turn-helix domain-containing protein n=1 Tax=Vibrio cholerae TaxID=666 RepID=UPI000218F20C|nr:helix-turn-helix domain-containing protein [Vibrio cholerae]EGQ8492635.1 hypothetical protein [Vibrio cholerae]EGQ9171249.1 hypothetical protein [Vibrio cholerae]EGQ9392122.1 hypothetical protein [Vibrio cholerae]EGR0539747.1 hypothetical protein [Vibrio cholerae]EGR08298.1 hypothetical protein VCHE48_2612 [Vibrio cholerae HE48]
MMHFNPRALRNASEHYRYWSTEEELRLFSLAKDHSAVECASLLGRTLKSVKQAALVRGVSFQKNPRKAFTESDDNYIRRYVGVLTTQEIASKLGRTRNSIKHRIRRLGLSKTFIPKVHVIYDEHDVELCRQLHESGLTIAEISRKMEISPQMVSLYISYRARIVHVPEFIYNIDELR